MEENEAIEWIKELKLSEEIREFYYAESYIKAFDMAIQALEEVQQYRQFGTVEECREAAEKQNPKEPDYEGDGYWDGQLVYDTWICPCCGHHYEVDYDNYTYCPNCGQKIDWGDEE